MALDVFELLIIGGLALAILVLGPKKIPEFARAVKQAVREFKGESEK